MSNSYRRPVDHDWNNPPTQHHDHHVAPADNTYTLPNGTYGKSQWESDAQIAARKAMSKRNSRSYSSRVSRAKSRRKEILGRPAKPTLDTSFTRHRGAQPRQVYPHNDELRSAGTVRRPAWFGLGRSGTRSKGLGIMKGTPQPESQPEDYIDSMLRMEISPSDRPIPIGISLPSDSVTDLSPYQTNRLRSGSDATLVTPSIIITPAEAMKSVWSPDTESEYTPSVYSRGTFNPYASSAKVPPVPAVPSSFTDPANSQPTSEQPQDSSSRSASHNRNGTLDSAGTAFEDDDGETPRKGRIMSTGTVFEEDELPLTARTERKSNLSLDTSVIPTPRRSQGWWNYITTPFEFTRQNSVWTQGGRNGEKTPDIPMMPPRFLLSPDSPSGRTTYMWSATDKSPSIGGDNTPMIPIMFSSDANVSNANKVKAVNHAPERWGVPTVPTINIGGQTNNNTNNIKFGAAGPIEKRRDDDHVATHPSESRDITSPLSAMSASPVVGTAAIGTVLMPRELPEQQLQSKQYPKPQSQQSSQPQSQQSQQQQQQQQQQQNPINVNIIFQDGRRKMGFHTRNASLSSNERSINVTASNPRSSTIANVEMSTPGSTFAQTPPAPQAPLASTTDSTPRLAGLPDKASEIAPLPMQVPTGPSSQATPSVLARQGLPSNPSPLSHNQYSFSSNTRQASTDVNSATGNGSQNASYQFPPPPHFAKGHAHSHGYASFDHSSRASSPVSVSKEKTQKKHRKVFDFKNWMPFGLVGRRDQNSQGQKKEMSRRKKWCWGCCCCLLILVLLAIMVPVIVVVTRKQDSGPSGSGNASTPLEGSDMKWLNLTGYPPMPTGISTIAQPEVVEEETGCIQPATAWSCSVPKEEQETIKPNKPDQPNLRLEIKFEKGAISDPSKTQPVKRAANPVSAGTFIRSLLSMRAAPEASPEVPTKEDYQFLGRTTDGNQAPFEGEETPFFFSLLETQGSPSSRLAKRVDITDSIPPPDLESDGSAAPANLLPLLAGQPLRLFNRDQENEHYGFFVYYDRSIFLKEPIKDYTRGGNPADKDGGSPKEAATMRCTWTQTRFLVQIWTKNLSQKPLLGSSQSSQDTDANADFKRPGSFPYPVTVTIDRHGGTATDKMTYCYKMETDGSIENATSSKTFLLEDRGFGGNRVNPSKGPTVNVTGPIDGGSGGCRCLWQNWLA